MFETKRILSVNLRGLYVVIALALLINGCYAQSKISGVPTTKDSAVVKPTLAPFKTGSKIKFSSAYTKLNLKTCKPMVKPENDEDEVPYFCTGYKGYKIYVNTHGFANFYIGREISKNIDALNLDGLPVFLLNAGFDQTIEWRLADGEPFACIVRAEFDKQLFQPYEPGMANELVVQNLKGFAPISISIDATKNKRANIEARRAADAAYRKL